MAKANAKSKATYRSNFANPAVRKVLQGRSVLDVARMDSEVKTLLNTTLEAYSDDYRGNIRRIITGTLDECVWRGIIPRHTLAGIELAPRVVTAEQHVQRTVFGGPQEHPPVPVARLDLQPPRARRRPESKRLRVQAMPLPRWPFRPAR